jgi:ribosomal protein L37AE/L43A
MASEQCASKKLRCPRCGGGKHSAAGPDLFKCAGCGGLFDGDPGEGGTHGNRPDARLDREERDRQRRLDRLGQR